MNVMHIDFFILQQKTETGGDEGFFSGGGRRGVVSCSCKQYIFHLKKKTEWVGSSSGKSASLHAVIKLLSGLWTVFQLHVCATH